jgi:hypothetical protein
MKGHTMSNTTRGDYYIEANGEPCFGKKWEAVMDKKKWYKPSKKQKNGYLSKIRLGRRTDMKKAMKHPDEDGDIILPVQKKTDVWYYN